MLTAKKKNGGREYPPEFRILVANRNIYRSLGFAAVRGRRGGYVLYVFVTWRRAGARQEGRYPRILQKWQTISVNSNIYRSVGCVAIRGRLGVFAMRYLEVVGGWVRKRRTVAKKRRRNGGPHSQISILIDRWGFVAIRGRRGGFALYVYWPHGGGRGGFSKRRTVPENNPKMADSIRK